ncbi:TIGR02234 family membrane protein, partial [Streptomyces californicus]
MEGVSAAPVPQPRTADPDPDPASGAAPDRAGSRRSLAAALFLGAVGAAVVLLASGQIWV